MVKKSRTKGFVQHTNQGLLWRGTIAIALATALLPACTRPEATAPETVQTETAQTEAKPVDDIEQLIGRTVTVRSEPIAEQGLTSFTIEDKQLFGVEPILVVNATGKPFALPQDDDTEVQVTGVVRQFVSTDIQREYNLNIQPELYTEYENKPAIIAESIALSPEPGQITENPQQYYGKTLAVTGEVEQVQGNNSFTLDEDELFGADDLLVLNRASNQVVQEGGDVAVTGVLRPFVVAELERDYGFTWDGEVRQRLETEYSNKPVLIAEQIFPSESD